MVNKHKNKVFFSSEKIFLARKKKIEYVVKDQTVDVHSQAYQLFMTNY